MKWPVGFALIALLLGITCGTSQGDRSSPDLFFIGPTSRAIPAQKHHQPADEKYAISPEYKNIYEIIKAQASTGVYFKPIEGYFGLYQKTTPQPSNGNSYLVPPRSIKPETSTNSHDYDATSTPYSTSTTSYSSYSSPTPAYQVSRPSDYASKAPETSSKYPMPYHLKAKETRPVKMNEPLFYSDYYNQPSSDVTTAANNYHKTSHSYETSTIKYQNSVPVYHLSNPYYANQETYATAAPSTTVKTTSPTHNSYQPVYTTSHDNNYLKETNNSSPPQSPSKARDAYLTTEKPLYSKPSTHAYPESTTKLSVQQHASYQKHTTPKSTSNYATSKPDSYEKVNDATTARPTKAQKRRPFRFSYAVNDKPSHNNYSHQQESDGNVVTGSYRVLLPDGRVQIVTYRADKNGYKADIRYEANSDTSSHQNNKPQQTTV